MSFWGLAASLVSGCFGGLGLGGGWILYAYLLSADVEPPQARGLVLLLFLPCAAIAAAGHAKNGLLRPSKLWLPAAAGLVFSLGGMWLFGVIPQQAVRWIMTAASGALGISEIIGGIRDAAAAKKSAGL